MNEPNLKGLGKKQKSVILLMEQKRVFGKTVFVQLVQDWSCHTQDISVSDSDLNDYIGLSLPLFQSLVDRKVIYCYDTRNNGQYVTVTKYRLHESLKNNIIQFI